jgi:nicotinamide-nucleotide adenylyltransferase
MMILFAEDLQAHLYRRNSMWTQEPIDVGLTTAPYYTDKSAAIANEEPSSYPSKPKHVHLIGFDTLTRFLAPKYYPKFNPPLRALFPFFDAGYGVSVLLRPSSSSDNAVTDDTEEGQRAYISALSNGSLEKEGFKREWSKQIGILEGDDVAGAVGISSTAVRKAAQYEDWGSMEKMCTPGVAAWVREMSLYEDEERGAKTT